jgi:DNA-binding transcriptional MerR regulator
MLTFVRRSRELGFSLDEVRALLRLGGPERATCREVREVATHHLGDIGAKISDLRKLERLLATTIARCTGTAAPECPLLDILDIERSKGPGNGRSFLSQRSKPDSRRFSGKSSKSYGVPGDRVSDLV